MPQAYSTRRHCMFLGRALLIHNQGSLPAFVQGYSLPGTAEKQDEPNHLDHLDLLLTLVMHLAEVSTNLGRPAPTVLIAPAFADSTILRSAAVAECQAGIAVGSMS
ncbi:hypothetical protein [Stutzerimonas azotifigens]|uniref:Uncharacterized protein n=1 Tax=Stutzerimonas azotifigens TaxID=291995 RepID=A0ABR5Z3K2_9GAMM|nr:hypothetical protein [Stutzerimonas azotifigens]MBA1274729.1 hypothetical protein [Stutzerimonas azotifigens]